MAVSELFTFSMGTILGVQLKPGTGVTTSSIVGVDMRQNNYQSMRHGHVGIEIDGDEFFIEFSLAEESFDRRMLNGDLKKRSKADDEGTN